jgi:hypothetical protein
MPPPRTTGRSSGTSKPQQCYYPVDHRTGDGVEHHRWRRERNSYGKRGDLKPIRHTVRGPKTLVAQQIGDAPNSTFAYQSTLNCWIKDNLGVLLPSSVPLNGFFTTGIVNDYPNTNSTRGPALGYTTQGSTPYAYAFADIITGQAANYYPSALPPQKPLPAPRCTTLDKNGELEAARPGTDSESRQIPSRGT